MMSHLSSSFSTSIWNGIFFLSLKKCSLNSLIRRLKSFYKGKPEIKPYKMAYRLMPSQASASSDAKQQYINGHFCYADKLAILTNGLSIIRHIPFLDNGCSSFLTEFSVSRLHSPSTKIAQFIDIN